jgi:hypothetical protein
MIEIRISSKTSRLHMAPFPLRISHCQVANCGFAAVFANLKLAGLWQLESTAGAEGNATAQIKN